MSHLADPSSHSPRHPAGLSSDYSDLSHDLLISTEGQDQASELSTLRDFNAKLLERISEIRRRNFELSKTDELLREKDLALTRAREQENNLRGKLAKLTDESWAKDLEIQALVDAKQTENGEIARLTADGHQLQRSISELQNRLAQSEKLITAKEAEIRFISDERAQSLQEITLRFTTEIAQLKNQNASLNSETRQVFSETQSLREQLAQKETVICELQRSHAEQAAKLQYEVEEEFRRIDAKMSETQTALEAQLQLTLLEKHSDLKTFAQLEADLNAQIAQLEIQRTEQSQQLTQSSELIISLEKSLAAAKSELAQTRDSFEIARREHEQSLESLRYQTAEKIRSLETEHALTTEEYEIRLRNLDGRVADRDQAIHAHERTSADQVSEISNLKSEIAEQVEALRLRANEIKSLREENLLNLSHARKREEDSLAALDQKIEMLRRQSEQDQVAAQRSEAELKAKLKELESELNDRSRQAIDSHHLAMNLKKELESAKMDLQTSQDATSQLLWETNQKHQATLDQMKKRETDLNLEICSLRSERTACEKRLIESNEKSAELRAALENQRVESRIELRNLRDQAEQAFIEMQATLKTKMQSDFQAKFETVLKENARIQALLDIKDNSADVERKELQKRQVQLSFLEQQLKTSATILNSDKSKIVSLSKQLATELQQNRSGLHSQRQMEERAHSLISIIKNINSGI